MVTVACAGSSVIGPLGLPRLTKKDWFPSTMLSFIMGTDTVRRVTVELKVRVWPVTVV